jgi:hypothetical protein
MTRKERNLLRHIRVMTYKIRNDRTKLNGQSASTYYFRKQREVAERKLKQLKSEFI